jgi:hypothetical protein
VKMQMFVTSEKVKPETGNINRLELGGLLAYNRSSD